MRVIHRTLLASLGRNERPGDALEIFVRKREHALPAPLRWGLQSVGVLFRLSCFVRSGTRTLAAWQKSPFAWQRDYVRFHLSLVLLWEYSGEN